MKRKERKMGGTGVCSRLGRQSGGESLQSERLSVGLLSGNSALLELRDHVAHERARSAEAVVGVGRDAKQIGAQSGGVDASGSVVVGAGDVCSGRVGVEEAAGESVGRPSRWPAQPRVAELSATRRR